MIRSRRPLAGALVLALALTAGACSSTSHSGASAPTSAAASAAPIKVGVICTCSGVFGATLLAARDVYQSWVNTVNGSGGIEGHRVQLVSYDDAGNPGTSVTDVDKLVQSDKVAAIVDLSNASQTWESTVQSANIPVVGVNTSEAPFNTNPDFYPEGMTGDALAVSLVSAAKAAGAKNVAYLYCAEAASCGQTSSLIKSVAPKVGIPVPYEASISFSAPNYTAQCVAAQQAHADAVAIGDAAVIIARVGADCARQGYNPIYVTGGQAVSMSLASAPGIKDNLWLPFNNLPFFSDAPAMKAMNAAVDQYYPGLRNDTSKWSGMASMSWSSGLLLEAAIKAGGHAGTAAPTAADITQGLNSLKADTLQGTAPPLTFKAGQPHPVHCWFTGKIQNGVPSVADGGRVTCENG